MLALVVIASIQVDITQPREKVDNYYVAPEGTNLENREKCYFEEF